MNRYFTAWKKVKRHLLGIGVAISLLAGPTAFAEMPEIMGLSELQQGMEGTGYTVIDASGEIRPFNAQVVGIMGSGKLSSPRILVNVSGAVMDETGGAVSGMSGSPIYFNGRLAGALSAGFTEMYTKRIMLTPIEDMLKIWEYPDCKNKTKLPTMNLKEARAELAKQEEEAKAKEEAKNPTKELAQAKVVEAAPETFDSDEVPDEEQSVVAEPEAAEDEAEAQGETAASGNQDYISKSELTGKAEAEQVQEADQDADNVEEKSVVLTAGFGSAGLKYLHQQMAALGLRFSDADTWGGNSSNDRVIAGATLQPGSPVGVSLAMGDFSYGAIGTVTAVDGRKVLAFGHPFTHRGNVNYFMTDASIVSTVHGPTSGKKLGEIGGIVGRINQDRENGVAGIIGEYPQVVPVIVKVTDKDTNRVETYNSVLAYDEEVVPVLAPVMVYSSMTNSMDRENPSTAELKFTLRTNVMKDGKVERSNMFYGDDVAKAAVTELTDVLKVLAANKDRESDLLDLKVDITLENVRKTASLVSAVPSKQEVLPGEQISLEATIKPFRGEKLKVSVPFTVPEHQPAGNLALDIHGGGLVNVAKLLLAQQAEQENAAAAAEAVEVSTEEQLTEMLKSKHNNDIVVETTVTVPKSDAELKDAIKQAKKLSERLARQGAKPAAAKKKAEVNNSVATDYIIENVIHANVKVVEPK